MPPLGPELGPPDVGASLPDRRAKAPRWRRLLLALAGVVVALLVLVHAPFVRDAVRRGAIAAARDRFDTALTIGRLDYNLLTLSVSAGDVVAAATRSPGSPFFRADSFNVSLSPAALVGRLAFSSVDVARPRLTIAKGADGRYGFPELRETEGPTPRVAIGRLSITGLDVAIEGTPPMAIEARDVSLDLQPNGGHIQGRVVAVNGTRFRTPSGEVLSIGVDGLLGLDPDAIRIGALKLTTADSSIDLDGRLQFAPGPASLDLAVRASVNLATAMRIWPAIGPGQGRVTATARISGALADLAIAFDASSARPTLRGISADKVSAHGRIEDKSVALSSASIEVAGGRVTGAATFGLGPGLASSAKFHWEEVGLAELLHVLAVDSPTPVAGRLGGDVAIGWSGRGLQSLALTATTRVAASVGAAATSLAGQSVLSIRNRRWTLDFEHELGAGTTVNGQLSGTINGTDLLATTVGGRLSVKGNADGIAAAVGRAPGATPAVRSVAARLHGDVQAGLDVSGTIGDPVIRGAVTAESLRVDGVGTGGLEAAVRVDRRAAFVETLSGSLAGATVHASGSVPFDRNPIDLAVAGEMDHVEAALGALPPRWRPSGSASIDARVSGPIASPRVDGTVSSAGLAWEFWRPGPIDADVRVADGRVQFVTRVPSLRGAVRGSVALSSPHPFDLIATLDGTELGRLGAIASGLGAPSVAWTGTTRLSARLTGAADDDRPLSVDVHVTAIDGSVDGRPLHLDGPARISGTTDLLTVDRLQLQVGDTRLSAIGPVSNAARGQSLRVEVDGEIGEWWPAAKGRLQGAFNFSGPPRRPALTGDASVASATVTWPGYAPLTGISARVRLANDTIELVEARASWSGASLAAAGRLPLAMLAQWLPDALVPERPAIAGMHVRADLTSLSERALEPWLGADAVSRIQGQVAASAEFDAPRFALDALRGTAVITQSETTIEGVTLRQPKPARLRFDDGRLQIDDASWAIGRRTLTLGGGIDLRGSRPRLDLALSGDVDLSMARVFVPAAVSGTAALDVRVTGDMNAPSFSGGATITNAALGIQDPRLAMSDVSGRVSLADDRLVVSAKGSVNGGTLDISGSLPVWGPQARPREQDGIRLRGEGLIVEWPEGLRTTLDADIVYRTDDRGGVVTGTVDAEPGVYRRTSLPLPLAAATGAGAPAPSRLGATRLDVAIATRSPAVLDNSYARVEVEGDVHLGGTVASPAIGGRLRARENGEVYLRGNVFKIERGILEFDPEGRSKPMVDLTAETRRSGYDISLRLSGRFDDLVVNLTSDPPLAQPDLVSLVTTGSTSNSMSPGIGSSGQSGALAAVSSDVLGLAGRSVGLDSVRVGELDLDLLGDDVDPQTRLTIGKSIGSWLNLLLSQNLRESGLTWVVSVRPRGSYEIRFVSRDSQSASVELRREMVLGGPRRPEAAPKPAKASKVLPNVTKVTVAGGGMPEHEVLAVTKVQPGGRFDFFEWQRDRERIEALFQSRGYLQVQVAATREAGPGGGDSVELRYQVRRGPLTRLRVTGFSLPEPVIEGMKAAWSRSVDDRFLQDDLRERARAALVDMGYLWPAITTAVSSTGEPREKIIELRIVPGARASTRVVAFSGNHAVSDRELQEEIAASGAAAGLWREPERAVNALTQGYRHRGFLAARVSAGAAVLDGTTARLPLIIDEGSRYLVSRVEVRGAGAIGPERVEQWAAMRVGDPFNPAEAPLAEKRIEAGYLADGYRSVRAEVAGTIEPGTSSVVIVAQVTPGVRSVIQDVSVTGRVETRESVVARALKLPAGSAASPSAVDGAQRRLYETQAFRSVDIQLQPIGSPGPGSSDQPTRAVVTLEEAPPYRIVYGVQVTDDLSPVVQTRDLRLGVSAELRRRNLFGSAFNGTVGGRYEQNYYSVRGALNIPTSVLWPATSTLYVKQSQTILDDPEYSRTRESSITYQDRWRLGRKTELSYGYSFSREDVSVGSSATDPAAVGTRSLLADIFSAIAWDSRDSVFNATRGWFHSSSVEYGAPAIGSDFSYLRYLFQQSYYRGVGPVVLAGAARFGALLDVTGTEVQTYTLRFRTGGNRTVRGYAEESLVPPGPTDLAGGRGLLVLNGEVRFPVWRWVKGVAFLDAGNAFEDVSAISLNGLKVGTGLGLRLDTPFAFFRLDIGFPIPQNSDRLIGRWYFSIGQAF